MIKPPFLKVKDVPGLVRDTSSNAILSTDLDAKRKYLEEQKRELNLRKVGDINNRVDHLEDRLGKMENIMSEILQLLKEKR